MTTLDAGLWSAGQQPAHARPTDWRDSLMPLASLACGAAWGLAALAGIASLKAVFAGVFVGLFLAVGPLTLWTPLRGVGLFATSLLASTSVMVLGSVVMLRTDWQPCLVGYVLVALSVVSSASALARRRVRRGTVRRGQHRRLPPEADDDDVPPVVPASGASHGTADHATTVRVSAAPAKRRSRSRSQRFRRRFKPAARGAASTEGPQHREVGSSAETRSGRLAVSGSLLAVVGLTASVVASLATKPSGLGYFGTLALVPAYWYVGVASILVATGLMIAAGRAPAVPAVCLLLALDLTPSILYPNARYPWAIKDIGITTGVLRSGHVNGQTSIFQAWPGLYGAVAWLCRLSGLHSPAEIARFWPVIVDLGIVGPFVLLATALGISQQRRWTAVILLILAETVGQNYFCPESLGLVLAIGAAALALNLDRGPRSSRVAAWLCYVLVALALGVLHQLAPYMAFASVALLSAFRLVRPWWSPIILLVPAVGWAALNLDEVRRYFQLGEVGNIVGNVRVSAGVSGLPTHLAELVHVNFVAVALGPGVVGILALVSLRGKTRRRLAVPLLCCAASPASLVLVQQYGSEGSFRVILFSVPWLVLTVATVNIVRRRVLCVGLLALLTAGYVESVYGLDWISVNRASDLAMERRFETIAPRGAFLVGIAYGAYFPTQSTSRYDILNFTVYDEITVDSADRLSQTIGESNVRLFTLNAVQTFRASTGRREELGDHLFVETGSQMRASGIMYGVYSGRQYEEFAQALKDSPWWQLDGHDGPTSLFVIRPKQALSLLASAASRAG